MTALSCVGVNVAAPAGGQLVAALTAITGGESPVWYPAVVGGTGGRGRTCEVQVGSLNRLKAMSSPIAPEWSTVTATGTAQSGRHRPGQASRDAQT